MKVEQTFSNSHSSVPRPQDSIAQIQTLLCDWFAGHKRDLPWRRTYTPYHVWISEVMLQQTQMERGVLYFERWMERFPTIASVAASSEEEVLRYWEGLGYYSRARNILKAAQLIQERFGGEFPSDPVDIGSLPGIGAYTKAAVASIAFQLPLASIDANVERVLARIFNVSLNVKSEEGKQAIADLAKKMLIPHDPRTSNQAVMEFGALVCSKKPGCVLCPVKNYCLALYLGVQAERPVKVSLRRRESITVLSLLFVRKRRVLLKKMPEKGLWPGLWIFPSREVCGMRACEPSSENFQENMRKACRELFGESLGKDMVCDISAMLTPDEYVHGKAEQTDLMTNVQNQNGKGQEYSDSRKMSMENPAGKKADCTISFPFSLVHSYTKWRVTLYSYLVSIEEDFECEEKKGYSWISIKDVDMFALPSPYRTIAEHFLKEV